MLSLKTAVMHLLTMESITLTPERWFTLYNASTPIRLDVRCGVATIAGAVKPTSNITGSATQYTICTIPEKYRPAPGRVLSSVQQGSGNSEWQLNINPTSGGVLFSRCRDTANNSGAYKTADTGFWLPFSTTWIVRG